MALLHGTDLIRAANTAPANQPDVVLIVVDDLNDWIGVMNGHPQSLTPHFDQLAARGVLFRNAHCNAPQCRPSRKSLLSGLFPKSTGTYFNNTARPSFFGDQPMSGKTSQAEINDPVILHEHFQRQGYRVVSGGKVAHYTKPKATLDAYLPLPKQDPDRKYVGQGNFFSKGAHDLSDEKTGDHQVASWAIKQWETVTDKPLLMTVGFYRPHRPLDAPRKYFERFPVEQVMLPLLPKFDDWNDLPTYAKSLARSHAHRKFHQGRFSDHEAIVNKGGDLEWKRTVGAYLSCVHYVDAQIGLLLEQFRRNPRRRPTMLILTSDHGWHLGEKKHWCKGALWRNTTRVPFIVVAPGLARAGTISDQPVSLVDVYPTLCEMANINPPPHLEGRSICGLLRDPELKRDFAFSSYGPRNTAVQTENLRYIRYEDQSEELYDHRSDPHEWDNLADRRDYAAIKKKLASAAMRFEEHPTN